MAAHQPYRPSDQSHGGIRLVDRFAHRWMAAPLTRLTSLVGLTIAFLYLSIGIDSRITSPPFFLPSSATKSWKRMEVSGSLVRTS